MQKLFAPLAVLLVFGQHFYPIIEAMIETAGFSSRGGALPAKWPGHC
jgi:hypothetical protein